MFCYAVIFMLCSVSLRGPLVLSKPIPSPTQPGSVGALTENDGVVLFLDSYGASQHKTPTLPERPSPTWIMFFQTNMFYGCIVYTIEMLISVVVCIWLGSWIAPKRQLIYTTMAATEI
uniref:Membrane protein a161 n=1 Tax=Mastomys natalensis cytomegalovirus 1 TaxID=2973541 RepID=A0A9Y1ILF7_9BETA|nr:membrane protein a161 [Mastomys natalensis cytomegalovirus 1]WEG71238.1 membrane protein a161 [Mastomys natalensis cytomegalovirus 1]